MEGEIRAISQVLVIRDSLLPSRKKPRVKVPLPTVETVAIDWDAGIKKIPTCYIQDISILELKAPLVYLLVENRVVTKVLLSKRQH